MTERRFFGSTFPFLFLALAFALVLACSGTPKPKPTPAGTKFAGNQLTVPMDGNGTSPASWCPAPGAVQTFTAGLNDNFGPAPDPPPSYDAAFASFLGVPPTFIGSFDSTHEDRHLLQTFSYTGSAIITALQLETRVKPLGVATNDAVNLWYGPGNNPTPISSDSFGSLVSQPWNSSQVTNPQLLTITKSSLSISGPVDIHVQIQDDTSVDYLILRLCIIKPKPTPTPTVTKQKTIVAPPTVVLPSPTVTVVKKATVFPLPLTVVPVATPSPSPTPTPTPTATPTPTPTPTPVPTPTAIPTATPTPTPAPSPTPTATSPTLTELCIAKYRDVDGNGQLTQPPDYPVGNVSYLITGGPNNINQTVTLPSSGYLCIGLPPGTYTVTELVPAGWVVTNGNPKTVTLPAPVPQAIFLNRMPGP